MCSNHLIYMVDLCHPQVFHLYIYLISLMFLSYLHAYLLRSRRVDKATPRPASSARNIQLLSNNQLDRHPSNEKPAFVRELEGSLNSSPNAVHKDYTRPSSPVSEAPPDIDESNVIPAITYTSGGVNFYLRLGAIGE